ncbi:MAG TPA: universal stress protein [Candidatus Aquilonibacter sp.]|nr:universal stress protein [Candidatus Aquilonibacter sp.]
MTTIDAATEIALKNILFLTDFSEPSEDAVPFVTSIARGYAAGVYALHVFMPCLYIYTPPGVSPATIGVEEEYVKTSMQRLDSQLAGLRHETIVHRSLEVWPAVRDAIREHEIDLIVLGTHGRTGAERLLLGSVAEEIFRRSPVPVLTIGPDARTGMHAAGHFRRVLFATDFTPASLAAAPYALSLAQGNDARLLLFHVMRHPEERAEKDAKRFELTVAEAIHHLYETIPKGVELRFPPEVLVEYGDPAERILEAARERNADLIVLGVRGASGHMGAATHLERPTAHKIVAHAACPVLTVRQ